MQPNLMKITLCVEENKIECKESGSDIKAIYQIPHFDLRKLIQKFFTPPPPLFEILA